MIIDMHMHPVLLDVINDTDEKLFFRKQQFGVFKSSKMPLRFALTLMDDAGVDKTVILGEDYSADSAMPLVSNDEIRNVMDAAPGRYIGFAGADPRKEDAPQELKRAFEELGLSGLHLNLSRTRLNVEDERVQALFQICSECEKPVILHAGYSWKPDTPSRYAEPILFEDAFINFPGVRFCLTHMGWPWWEETIMLLMKYPNVYADTATVYMDSPTKWFKQLFSVSMDIDWLQNSFADKVMYGSNMPRWRQVRSMKGLKDLPLRKDVLDAVLGQNAERFLGKEAVSGR